MNKQADEPEVEIPPECYQLDKVPHEYVSCLFGRFSVLSTSFSWLFPQIDAALHHGGAGTTGASLRGK
jgi:sterol 3beta-glucosyltransferase